LTAVVLLIVVVAVLLLAKSFYDAHRASAEQGGRPAPKPRAPRPARARPTARRRPKPVDRAKLADHVKKLKDAVEGGLITTDEAVASIIRHSDGQLSEEAARKLLADLDAA
jgi:hypothetical protein